MEKPEWFQEVDALDGAAESVLPERARARTARLTQGFALLGVAAVIAAGGYAFQQTGIGTSSNNAISSAAVPAPALPTSAGTNATASGSAPVAGATGTAASPVALTGKPSITGAAAAGGDDGDD
ncbi:hypothetical protein GALL_430590 [mine drainage metagenome]|uniref:Uncharacterized protein n=1 Tax=mine drainage metagenome TaxID=410659 RepID=A0A1J5QCR1_9ZZZZ